MDIRVGGEGEGEGEGVELIMKGEKGGLTGLHIVGEVEVFETLLTATG